MERGQNRAAVASEPRRLELTSLGALIGSHHHRLPGSTCSRGIYWIGGRSSLQDRIDLQHDEHFPTPDINDHVDRCSFKCEDTRGKRHSGTKRRCPFRPTTPATGMERLCSTERYVSGIDGQWSITPRRSKSRPRLSLQNSSTSCSSPAFGEFKESIWRCGTHRCPSANGRAGTGVRAAWIGSPDLATAASR
jgi:hypothetical protein